MGTLENKSRRRTRKGEIQKAILKTISAVGFLSIAVVAPNALKALTSFGIITSSRTGEVIIRSRKRLVQSGLLEYTPHGLLRLTEKGKVKLRQLELSDYALRKPKRWDKKWRVLIFDIKEERRLTRAKIRHALSTMGFVRLQHSVWVYPYDCEDTITLLKADFKLGKDLLYLIVDTIENDKKLKQTFGLP